MEQYSTSQIIFAVALYLIVINLIAFLMMYIDKRKAEQGKWRIEESTLFTLAIMGGSVGAILGMYKFRHKTKKLRFTIGFPTILIAQIVLSIYYIFFHH